MWKTLAACALLASSALAQQRVLDDTKAEVAEAATLAHTPYPPWSTVTPGVPSPAINGAVKSLALSLMRQAKMKGLSIGVVLPDNSVELAGLGTTSERGDSMTTDTTFVIASCSKAFLTATVGILIDDFANGVNKTSLPSGVKKLDWYTKVTDLLPDDWKLMDEWATEKATLRDIFSHQSGLPRHDFSYKPTDKPLDVLHRMQHLRPSFELRQRWHYNNQMFVLGAHLVSTYSGLPYIDYVQERIFEPLNMTSTTFSPNKALESGKRSEAWAEDGRLIPFWFTDDMTDLNAGQGGIISNVEDMTKWVRMMLNEGVDSATNKTVLPHSAYTEITTNQAIVSGRTSESYFSPNSYGLGWMHKSYQGHEMIEHGGAIPGFSAEVVFLPFEKLGIVTLANGAAKHQQELAVIFRIIEDYFKLPHKESERLAKLTRSATSTPTASPTPSGSPLTLSLADYAGHYYDEGYGTITLCAPTSAPSIECTGVLHAFAPFYNTSSGAAQPSLYAAVSSLWISHLRLEHTAGDAFALHGSFLFPDGFGRDRSPFEMSETDGAGLVVEFIVEQGRVRGLALNGLVGELTNAQRVGGSLKDTAEVWFEKI